VPARTSSAIVEGLATSGRPYLTKVISLNSSGDHAESTAARGFFSAGGGVNGQAVDEYALQVVGGAIKSPNYLAGSTGWIIRNDGSTEFGSATVRGNITAGTISIGTSPNWFNVDSAGNIWSGGATYSVGTFKVSNTGALAATGANISGAVTATTLTATGSGTIGGWSIGPTTLTGGPLTLNSSGNMTIYTASGATNYTLSLSSGGLTSKTFNTRYALFDIQPTQVRSNAYFTGYDTSTNANIQDTVIIFTNAIQLSTRPISPGYALAGGIDISCSEYIAGQAVGNISVFSKNSSASTLQSITLNNGNITSSGFIAAGGSGVTDAGSVSSANWFRSTGGTGWYNQTYGGGIWMNDSTYVKVYNNKQFYVNNTMSANNYYASPDSTQSGAKPGIRIDRYYYWAAVDQPGYAWPYENFAQFVNTDSNTETGSISISGGGVAFNTSSDRRLKENVINMTESLDVLKQLNPVEYSYIGFENRQHGFIAQDVYSAYPHAVKVGDDAETPEVVWGMDYGKLTPLIVNAIKELAGKVEKLESMMI
jgi:hypothetical protein